MTIQIQLNASDTNCVGYVRRRMWTNNTSWPPLHFPLMTGDFPQGNVSARTEDCARQSEVSDHPLARGSTTSRIFGPLRALVSAIFSVECGATLGGIGRCATANASCPRGPYNPANSGVDR